MGTDGSTARAWRIKLRSDGLEGSEPEASTRYQADMVPRFVNETSPLAYSISYFSNSRYRLRLETPKAWAVRDLFFSNFK